MKIKKQDRRLFFLKSNNSGSTLITVLVAVSFLIVLTTIILSVSMSNLQMKQVEYAMKKNFYADEQVLDDIYNGIGKVAAECLSKSYAEVLSQVSNSSGAAVYKDQEAAFKAFSNKFKDLLAAKYPVCNNTDTTLYPNLLAMLRSYITKTDTSAEVISFLKTEIIPVSIADSTPFQYIFRDVIVKYKQLNGTTETGYESTITTDIVIEIPYINFFRDSSVILDYALIGNKGVYFDSGARETEGNVYAGINNSETPAWEKKYRNEDVNGGLNIYNAIVNFNSSYLISKGDLNVRKSTVTMQNKDSSAGTQLWVESIKTAEDVNKNAAEEPSSLSVKGNMYVANDLELNARAGTVLLEGAYYGYNNGIYVTQEKGTVGADYAAANHTQSSSVIINGNRSTLDLSKLTTLIIAGVAYIDLQSQAYLGEAPGNIGGNGIGLIEEYATGESLALKTNQYMYLAPASCLYTTNPIKTADAPAAPWAVDSTWFGVQKGYVNAANPLISKEVLNRTTNESYTYYFLNFNGSKTSEYANLVLNMIDPVNSLTDMDSQIYTKLGYNQFDQLELSQIWQIKKELQMKAANPGVQSIIQMADDTKAGIYTQGALTEVSAGGLYSKLPGAASALALDYITKVENNIQKHYKHLYAELDSMDEFSITSDTLPDIAVSTIDSEAPVSKYIDFSGILSNLSSMPDYKCNGNYETYISPADLTVTSNVQGIILCQGNVTIKGGVDVEGLVIAGGKIVIEGDGSIKANRSIVQAILDEEMTEESKKEITAPKNMYYASSYFKDFNATPSGIDNTKRISSTEYTDYISYQNWRKGGGN